MLIEFTEKACQVLFVLFWTLIVCTDLLRSYNFSSHKNASFPPVLVREAPGIQPPLPLGAFSIN